MRPCLVCRTPTPNTRCPACQREKDRATWEPGQYGGLYRRNRRTILAQSVRCWRCGKPGATTADHIIPRALGGSDELSNLRPAHARCNSAAGATVRTGTTSASGQAS